MSTLLHMCPGKKYSQILQEIHHQGPKQSGLVGAVTAHGSGAGMKWFQPKQFCVSVKSSLQSTCLKFRGEEESLKSFYHFAHHESVN